MGIHETVLVTGGCGSVGSAVVRYLLETDNPPEIVVFDNDERRLFELREEIDPTETRVAFEFGDIRDRERLAEVLRDADHVVHAAALKQVPQCERQPYQTARTNIDGTRNVVKLAGRHGVDSVLTVSTDKATNPTSTMGASKLLAERVTLTADARTGADGPSFNCVRLGNVVGSSGSVVPVFLEQIRNGGPVTLTDSRMTRFVVSKREAAAFIVDHVTAEPSGVTYIPDLDKLRIEDLAEVLVETYGERYADGDVRIEETGRRPGERLHELLLSPDELHRTVDRDEKYVVYPPSAEDELAPSETAAGRVPTGGLSSKCPAPMSHSDIRRLVEESSHVAEEPVASEETVSLVSQHD